MATKSERQTKPTKNSFLLRFARWPVAPLLVGCWPILARYRLNIKEVYPSELVLPLVATVLFGLVCYWLIYRLTKRQNLALVFSTAIVLTNVYFAEIATWMNEHIGGKVRPGLFSVYLAVLLLIVGFLLIRKTKDRSIQPLSLLLNVAISYIIITNILTLLSYAVSHQAIFAYQPDQTKAIATTKKSDRDVYYLVFDRYPNKPVLSRVHEYDNQPFINELKGRGFQVDEDAHSNYQFTFQSVASTMNATHLQQLERDLGNQPYSGLPMRNMMSESTVSTTFKQAGYEHIHIGSWWGPTRKWDSADQNYRDGFTLTLLNVTVPLPEFTQKLIERTLIGRLVDDGGLHLGGFKFVRFKVMEMRDLALYQFESLREVAKRPGNQFVTAHVLSPHDPYIFKADGSKPTYGWYGDQGGVTEEEKFREQLIFVNGQITQLIDDIRHNSDNDPIFIIQADEGPYPRVFRENYYGYNWLEADQDTMREKMGILAAYYVGGSESTVVPDDLGSLNIFPFVFNNVLGSKVPYQPNKAYLFDFPNRYKFREVTDQLQYE